MTAGSEQVRYVWSCSIVLYGDSTEDMIFVVVLVVVVVLGVVVVVVGGGHVW